MATAWYEANGRRPSPADGTGTDPAALLSQVLDRTPRAIVVVKVNGEIVYANAPGAGLLASSTMFRDVAGRLEVVGDQAVAINLALVAAADPDNPRATCLLTRPPGAPPCVLSVGTLSASAQPAHVLLILQALQPADRELPRRLQQLFGLTPAESEIAMGIADGRTVRKIAAMRQVSGETIKVQLKSLTRKLGCRRQAEVASIVRGIFPIRGGDHPA